MLYEEKRKSKDEQSFRRSLYIALTLSMSVYHLGISVEPERSGSTVSLIALYRNCRQSICSNLSRAATQG